MVVDGVVVMIEVDGGSVVVDTGEVVVGGTVEVDILVVEDEVGESA